MRAKFGISTVCYLIENDKVLFLKFNKKWGQVYCPPGGKEESNESPIECIIREFKEETGLEVIDPKLKGISYWNWKYEDQGIIFIYTATTFKGSILENSEEGKLQWIAIEDIKNLKQFDMNSKFTNEIFSEGMFEGSFILNEDDSVKSYVLRKI